MVKPPRIQPEYSGDTIGISGHGSKENGGRYRLRLGRGSYGPDPRIPLGTWILLQLAVQELSVPTGRL